MCDTNKYYKMYQEMKKLTPSDTLQLIMEAKSKEEQDFFGVVGDFLLQQKQKELLARNGIDKYDHAVLGESLELCKDAADWFAAEQVRLEKSRKASKEVMDSIRPMVERNR